MLIIYCSKDCFVPRSDGSQNLHVIANEETSEAIFLNSF